MINQRYLHGKESISDFTFAQSDPQLSASVAKKYDHIDPTFLPHELRSHAIIDLYKGNLSEAKCVEYIK